MTKAFRKYADQLVPGGFGAGQGRNMATPQVRRYDYHDGNGAADPINVELRDRRFEAISIGPGSDLDAAVAVIEGRAYPFDLASPLVMPIEDTLEVQGFYGRYTDSHLIHKIYLEMLLWPVTPPFFPPKRGPRRLVPSVNTETITQVGTGEVVDLFSTHGRATARISFRTADAVSVRIAALTIRPLPTMAPTAAEVEHAIWPTVGDPTAWHDLTTTDDQYLVIDTEGWEYLKIYAVAGDDDEALEHWWSVHD